MRINIFRYMIVLLLYMSVWSKGYGQTGQSVLEPVPATPQTDGMIRYGKYDTQLFTGKLNLTIPIYHIQDPDFDLPISLIYTADAFKPRQSSGYVGQNWFLQAGGCVHREIKGYADESLYTTTNPNDIGAYHAMGTWIYAQQHSHSAKEMYDMSSSIFEPHPDIDSLLVIKNDATSDVNWDIESYPDIYHFNFCGHSGSFTINNQGKPIILSGDFVEVDLIGLGEEKGIEKDASGYKCPKSDSRIVIRTLDGYEYTFGGNVVSLEYSLRLPSDEARCNGLPAHNDDKPIINNGQTPCVESWYLTEMKAPNGRIMNFNYYSDYTWDFNVIPNASHIYPPTSHVSSLSWGVQKTRQALLSSITIPDTQLRIDFISDTTNQKLFQRITYAHNTAVRLLTSIDVQCKNKPLCTADLSYVTRTNVFQENYWHYLQDVTINGIGRYSMTYKNNSYPYLSTPCLIYSPSASTDLYGYDRRYADLGMIERFTFPTGGYQTFTFANHSTLGTHQWFGCFPHEYPQFFFAVDTVQSLDTIGGKRIQKVETYDSNGYKVETAEYTYGTCTFYEGNIKQWDAEVERIVNLGLLASPYYKFSTHIGYEMVTKSVTTSTTTESVIYNFYTGETAKKKDLIGEVNHYPLRPIAIYLAMSGMPFYESSLERIGTLQQQTIHVRDVDNVSSTLTKIFQYNDVPTLGERLPLPLLDNRYNDVDTVCLFSRTLNISSTRYLFASPHFLTEVIEEYKVNGKRHLKRIGYEYDKKKRVTQQITEGSDGRKYFERYTYPDAINYIGSSGGYGKGYRALIAQHRINQSIETVQGYIEPNANTEYITAGNISLYTAVQGTLEQTAALTLTNPITDYEPVSVLYLTPNFPKTSPAIMPPDSAPQNPFPDTVGTQVVETNPLVYDARYRTTCNYTFGPKMRIQTVQPVGNPMTAYTWTTDNLYPASKTTLGRTTSYTYKPYVGIETITDENGLVTYYLYDNHGRLIEVYRWRNGKKEVLEAYNYHIISE